MTEKPQEATGADLSLRERWLGWRPSRYRYRESPARHGLLKGTLDVLADLYPERPR